MKHKAFRALYDAAIVQWNKAEEKAANKYNAKILVQSMMRDGIEIYPALSDQSNLIKSVEVDQWGNFTMYYRYPGEQNKNICFPYGDREDREKEIIDFVLNNKEEIMERSSEEIILVTPKVWTKEEIFKKLQSQQKKNWLKPEPARHVQNKKNIKRGQHIITELEEAFGSGL